MKILKFCIGKERYHAGKTNESRREVLRYEDEVEIDIETSHGKGIITKYGRTADR